MVLVAGVWRRKRSTSGFGWRGKGLAWVSLVSVCLETGAIGAFQSKGFETYQLSIIPGDNYKKENKRVFGIDFAFNCVTHQSRPFFFSSRMSPCNFGIRSTHLRGVVVLMPCCLDTLTPYCLRLPGPGQGFPSSMKIVKSSKR